MATDTTISTNGDYSVFVNQPKEFILKLTLHEERKPADQSLNGYRRATDKQTTE
jgi:hypothetical protein